MLSSISLQYLWGTQKISLTCREFKDTISNEKKGREKEIDPVNEIVISGGTMENRRVRGALSATALIPAMAGNESPQFVRLKLSRHYAREFLLTFLHLSSTPSPLGSVQAWNTLWARLFPAIFHFGNAVEGGSLRSRVSFRCLHLYASSFTLQRKECGPFFKRATRSFLEELLEEELGDSRALNERLNDANSGINFTIIPDRK